MYLPFEPEPAKHVVKRFPDGKFIVYKKIFKPSEYTLDNDFI